MNNKYLTRKMISVIPIAYGDEGNVKELYKRTTESIKKISPNYEIIYVNDRSPDKTQSVLEELAKKDKRLTVILHSRNFGAQNAFSTGMKQAIGDCVVLMDGDLQDPPELISKFVEKWLEGYDVVYGVRKKREKSMGFLMERVYHLFYVIYSKLSYINVPTDAGEFSLMDRRVVDSMNDLPEKDRFLRGLRAWVGYRQTGVSYIRPERFSGAGVSTTNIFKGIWWARRAIFSFSYAPLEWIFYIAVYGLIISLIALVGYFISYFLMPGAPRGFMTLLMLMLFMGSVQLAVLAIISEYLRRIFEEVKSRPTSIVDKIINNHKK